MTDTEQRDYDWDLPCSDDELTKQGSIIGKSWAVEANELEGLYKDIDEYGTLTLQWTCLGRQAPANPAIDPVTKENQSKVVPISPIREQNSNFDFTDEVGTLRLRVRHEKESKLRGSAKKKTTSFDDILTKLIRQKCQEQIEKDTNNAINLPTNQQGGQFL